MAHPQRGSVSRYEPRMRTPQGMPGPGDIRPMGAPTMLREGETIRGPEAYQASRSTGGFRPPMPPDPRMQRPTYEPPESMGWQKALLGIAASGGAGLIGQGAHTADAFFNGPTRTAEADYAREYGAYQDSENSWNAYYGRVLQGETLDMQHKQMRATERNRADTLAQTQRNSDRTHQERMSRPFTTGRGGLLSREGEELHPDNPYGSDTQGGRDRAQASQIYAADRNRDVSTLEPWEHEEAWIESRRRQGLEVMTVVIKNGRRTRVPRSEAHLYESPADYFDAEGNPIAYPGGPGNEFPNRARPDVIDETDILRIETKFEDRRIRVEERYTTILQDWTAPDPGDPDYEVLMKEKAKELEAIETARIVELETARKGDAKAPGATADGIPNYDPRSGKVVY